MVVGKSLIPIVASAFDWAIVTSHFSAVYSSQNLENQAADAWNIPRNFSNKTKQLISF